MSSDFCTIPTLLLTWDTDLENPIFEYSKNLETVSFSYFPDSKQSFVLFEGFLFDKFNFHAHQNQSDAFRVAEYYLKYGEDLFEKLRGGFSLIIWDSARKLVIAGRDHMGQIPLYYYWKNNFFIISTSMNPLLIHPNVESDFNRVIIMEYLLNQHVDSQITETFFDPILRLPPAHYLTFRNLKISQYHYWNPIPPGYQWATKDEVKYFNDLFEQSVDRCLKEGADSISLSGGLDSVSIAVMANKINKSDQSPLHAISGIFPGTGADEGEIQLAIADALNMPYTTLSLEELLKEETKFQTTLEKSFISPIPNLNLMEFFYSEMMWRAAKAGLKKMILGTGGDELFFVDGNWAYDLFYSLKFKDLVMYFQTMSKYMGYSFKEAARSIIWGRILKPKLLAIHSGGFSSSKAHFNFSRKNLPLWISSNKDYLEILENRIPTPDPGKIDQTEGKYSNSVRYKIHHPSLTSFLEHRYYYGQSIGYTNLYPFFDMDFMSLALRMAPNDLIGWDRVKAPLVNFLSANLSNISIPNRKTDYSHVSQKFIRHEITTKWQGLGSLQALPKLGIIDQDLTEQYIENYVQKINNDWHSIWLLINTESWLRSIISNIRRK